LKIDFSTIVLIVLLVAPGLLARKSRDILVSKSFEDQGPTTEIGELVTLGLFPHLLVLFTGLVVLLASGLLFHRRPFRYISFLDSKTCEVWCRNHRVEAIALFLLYVLVSLITGYLLGFLLGWLKLRHPIREWIFSKDRFRKMLVPLRIFSVLDESPISYEIFSRPSLAAGKEQIVFLELELRESAGFLTGEVEQYAIVRDEEPHKPVVLRDAWYRATKAEEYERLDSSRTLVDLSDALVVNVSYQDKEAAAAAAAKD
jgi:hypothetical protein